ncbi:SlyX family protein [Pseudooceanicola nitratireducens]|jgi:SlyX protein|uniref:SlyX family protein n=1 Tax=Pseudooceanicola nitratireducens TaxID=517719 RepID=UPI001C97D556|nr:SlyX family protein [Pseudooceanicola nitratireducens]MBY6158007.1 SlyX family protein [Pseudooceanicola nitratireducens]MBY6164805.1 SlyX family protein [Pseudooceanicola nitratireducens]MEC7794557.1 SlyX family protein [Pseudomonadota bacterium]MEC9103569.1 SlyX family protein [Pseudomonadota bacterium]
MIEIEERLAHLDRTVEDLSTIIARQEREIAQLTRRVQMLLEREAEREASQGDAVIMGDERPPHY